MHNTFQDLATLQYQPAAQFDFLLNNSLASSVVGAADGYDFTNEVNLYLLFFFNHFLKGESSSIFESCKAISTNSLLYCNSGIINF